MFEVRAEMVANVWKHVVHAGDEIVAGDVVAMLESMKMEIPVYAEVGGVVTRMVAVEGTVVQEGDVVALIESALNAS